MTVSIVSSGIVVGALLCAGCASGPTYSPPPERRASERCPVGEAWVCQDPYPSRLEKKREQQLCSCQDLRRVR